MKRIILILVVIAMFFSLFGCKRKQDNTSLSKEDAQVYMEQTLEEKYGKDFELFDLESRHSSGPFNSMPGFTATAAETGSSREFCVEYDKETGIITDDYARYTYGDMIKEQVREIINNRDFLYLDILSCVYPLSEQNWIEAGYEAYLNTSGVYVFARLTMDVNVVSEEKAEEILALCEEMISHNIYFSFSVYHDDLCAVISCKPGENIPTLDEIYELLSRR